MEDYKYDVYICSSQEDWNSYLNKSEISRIIMQLDSAGISYWVNKAETELREDRTEIIGQNINASKVFLYLYTRNASDDSSCDKEKRIASELNKYIISVCIDDPSNTDMIYIKNHSSYYIEYHAAHSEIGLIQLINTIRTQLEILKAEESKKQLYNAMSRNNDLEREEKRIREEIKRREKSIKEELETLEIIQRRDELQRREERIREEIEKMEIIIREKMHSLKELQEIEANLELEKRREEEEIRRKKEKTTDTQNYFESSKQGAHHRDISFTGRSNTVTVSHSESTVIENSYNTYGPNYKQEISSDRTPKTSKISIFGRLFQSKKKNQLVLSSIFAPGEVKRETHMLVQVYLHLPEETEKVQTFAQEADKNAERRDYIPLQCRLKKGDIVDVIMCIYGETTLMSEKKSVVWQGSFTKCSFDYFVPKDLDIEELSYMAMLTVNGVPAGEMRFITKIVEKPRQLNPEIFSKQYQKIFISYAHQDEPKVEQMARAYKAQGVEYFFDRHYLQPGDIFPIKIREFIDSADLFILCWSANAANSDYVDLERKRALERAYPKIKPIEKAPLRIYPMSIEPRAELPDDMRDTYNFEII